MQDALSTHYAKALADAVFGPKAGLEPTEAVAQLRDAVATITGSKDLQGALLSPAISRARKTAVIGRLADEMHLHRLLRNFLLVVVNHRRTSELNQILNSFEEAVDQRTGFVPAEISSAVELNAEQRDRIERALGTKLGKYIRPRYIVNPDLLGGVLARVASREYDGTLRGKLESMRYRLAAR